MRSAPAPDGPSISPASSEPFSLPDLQHRWTVVKKLQSTKSRDAILCVDGQGALGGYGEYVDKPEDIRPALERARKKVDEGMVALVNVRTDYRARFAGVGPGRMTIRLERSFRSPTKHLRKIWCLSRERADKAREL
jgi:hypothetical protein